MKRVLSLIAILSVAFTAVAFRTVTAEVQPFAYVTNALSNNVSVIDTATNTVVATIPVGNFPLWVEITPDGARAFVTNTNSNNVSVIDTATNTVVATVPVGSAPQEVAITPDGTRAYVANQSSNNVSVINTATYAVDSTVTVGAGPRGVAITADGARAYVANTGSSSVSVIDTATDTVVATVPLPPGSRPFMVAITPDGAHAYVTNQGPLPPIGSSTVLVIDTATNTVVATVTVENAPAGVVITLDGTRAYVSNEFSNNVSVIDTATNTVVGDPIPVENFPIGIAITPDGARVYVAHGGSTGDKVSVIDTATNTVIATIQAESAPFHVAITPAPTPNHYLSYKVKRTKGTPKFEKREVILRDQFGEGVFRVEKPDRLYNPADKNGEGIPDLDTYLVGYKIKRPKGQPKHVSRSVRVTNQFGELFLDTKKPDLLLVPSAKSLGGTVAALDTDADHFMCYKVKVTKGTPKFEKRVVTLSDQFEEERERDFRLENPSRLCNPVEKTVGEVFTEIQNPDNHLLGYKVKRAKGEPKHEKVIGIHTNNQFGPLAGCGKTLFRTF